mmetsp:Transcript_40347/g.90695  ORF Transcript_40347/g.90695 Transcript_40347/m.90695 type:complete len:384 (-) Transcript_40347:71-1222(-)
MVQRVGHTAVLSLGRVEVVRGAILVNPHILHQSILLDGAVDLRLILFRQVNCLGIAATLKVENAILIPAMLIIAKQQTIWVSGQGGLASARQAKEQSSVSVMALVGRAVHGHDAIQRQQVVHDAKHALLHLTTILGTTNDGQSLLNVEGHIVLSLQAVLLPLGVLGQASVDDGEVGLEVGDLLVGGRAHKHVAHEVAVPGPLGVHANALLGLGVGAAPAIEHVVLLGLATVDVVDAVLLQVSPYLGRDRLVGIPPHVVGAGGLLGLHVGSRRAASPGSSVGVEAPIGGNLALPVAQLVLAKLVVVQVTVDGNVSGDAILRFGAQRLEGLHGAHAKPTLGGGDAHRGVDSEGAGLQRLHGSSDQDGCLGPLHCSSVFVCWYFVR